MATPVVAQLNDDNGDGLIDGSDNPDVIFSTYNDRGYRGSSVIRAVSGEDGSEIWSTDVLPTAFYSPAAGDIDGDGLVEIVTSGGGIDQTPYLVIYENDGSLKFQTVIQSHGSPYLADLEGDGNVEIILGSGVYDNLGNLLFNIQEDGFPIALDVDLDNDLEVFSGGRLYDHEGKTFCGRWKLNLSTALMQRLAISTRTSFLRYFFTMVITYLLLNTTGY